MGRVREVKVSEQSLVSKQIYIRKVCHNPPTTARHNCKRSSTHATRLPKKVRLHLEA